MIRLFAAIGLPDEIGAPLLDLRAPMTGARWRPLEALHVTLRFFGAVREDVADDLDSALASIAFDPFAVTLKGVNATNEGENVTSLWAGVTENEPLRRLAGRCESAARQAGLKPEPRVFRPHVTLAYLKHPDAPRVAAWIQTHNLLHAPTFAVDRFGLYSSRLGAEGSVYRLEREYGHP